MMMRELLMSPQVDAAHPPLLGDYADTCRSFTWDAARGAWLRSQAGTPHVDTAGVQLAPANVVVLATSRFS